MNNTSVKSLIKYINLYCNKTYTVYNHTNLSISSIDIEELKSFSSTAKLLEYLLELKRSIIPLSEVKPKYYAEYQYLKTLFDITHYNTYKDNTENFYNNPPTELVIYTNDGSVTFLGANAIVLAYNVFKKGDYNEPN